MLTIHDRPLAEYVAQVESRVPFAFSRWGDGEWMSLLAMGGATCDGQEFTSALRRALTGVLESRPTYELALGPFAVRRFGTAMEQWLSTRGLSFRWTSANVFAYAARDGHLQALVEALRQRSIVLVGPDYLLDELSLFSPVTTVKVSGSDAFGEVKQIGWKLERALSALRHREPLAAISAGPAAKVLVHEVSKLCPFATLIDFGSVWDPFAGRMTRTYQEAVSLTQVR